MNNHMEEKESRHIMCQGSGEVTCLMTKHLLSQHHVAHPLLIRIANIKMSTCLKLSSNAFMLTALLRFQTYLSMRTSACTVSSKIGSFTSAWILSLSPSRLLHASVSWCQILMVTAGIASLPLPDILRTCRELLCLQLSGERLPLLLWLCTSNLAILFDTNHVLHPQLSHKFLSSNQK